MSDAWSWAYDPDAEHVIGGIPDSVIKAVERAMDELLKVCELADTGFDVSEVGSGGRPGGLRRFDTGGGWFLFIVDPPKHQVIVVRVVPPFEAL